MYIRFRPGEAFVPDSTAYLHGLNQSEAPEALKQYADVRRNELPAIFPALTFLGGIRMLPVLDLRIQMGALLAADPTTLAPATNGNKIALIKAAFTPSESLAVEDLVLADFTGSTPLQAGTGAQPVGTDPNTGEQVIAIKDPAGGWRWHVTGTANLPQTIYGYALVLDDLTLLWATALFDAPIPLTNVGQQIVIGAAELTIISQPIV